MTQQQVRPARELMFRLEVSSRPWLMQYKQMRVLDPRSGEILINAVEARGVFSRMRGLIGRDVGPLALRTRQVHTFGMRSAIEAVYLSKDGEVVRVAHLAPRRLGPLVPRARWVIELAPGEAQRLGITKGRVFAIDG